MFYVYILENNQSKLYIGYTRDLKKRLVEHNKGQNISTRGHRWRCIYYEACTEELDAKRREGYLKKTQGKRMLKRRLYEFYKKRKAT